MQQNVVELERDSERKDRDGRTAVYIDTEVGFISEIFGQKGYGYKSISTGGRIGYMAKTYEVRERIQSYRTMPAMKLDTI